jgi:CspA family cold shock protein
MSSDRQTGRVKWFNKKSGYGFLTVCDSSSDHKDKDIFAHFSSLRGEDEQYKYLVQGEYVEFNLVESKGDKHEFQAASISGVLGGQTMCDTHRENPRPTMDNNRDTGVSRPPNRSRDNYRETGESQRVNRREGHHDSNKEFATKRY